MPLIETPPLYPASESAHRQTTRANLQKDVRTRAIYVAGTHWDREWFEPFQEFRMWLVQVMDRALDRLARDDNYRVFHLDGQAVLLEDYLEIRPDREEELTKRLKEGRLVAGPWYAMPDLWLVSGESLIRNFQRGIRVVRKLGGEPSRVAYTPDLFGHIASMPMIFRGFNLPYCVVWRGINDEDVPVLFNWVGPDGSEVLTHHLPDNMGYGWWGGSVRWPWVNSGHDPEVLAEKIRAALRAESKRADGLPVLYLSDAGDHQFAPEKAPEMVRLAQEAMPDVELVIGSMGDYFDQVSFYADSATRKTGELRNCAKNPQALFSALIPHCLSSRYPLKQANDRCQNLLTLWAEPLAALAKIELVPLPAGFLDLAWKYLLLNQPHDSICGCSTDETHADMPYRYHQSELLGDLVRRQAVVGLLPVSAELEDVSRMAVWNPLPWSRKRVQELELLFPIDYSAKAMRSGHNAPTLNQFRILDSEGNPCPWQLLSVECSRRVKSPNDQGRRTLVAQALDVYRVAVEIDLPPTGMSSLRVEPLRDAVERQFGSLRVGALSASNGLISLTVGSQGEVNLRINNAEVEFPGLFLYEDSGDAGDGWNYVPPIRNQLVVGHGSTVNVAIEEDGPLQVTFRIDRLLQVPVGLDPVQREFRNTNSVGLSISDFLTIRKGEDHLHVRTIVHNNAQDHRLRVLFPTGRTAATYWSDQPFAWVERPTQTDPASFCFKEPDPPERPHHSVFAIGNEEGGLAVVSPEGLHEHSIEPDKSSALGLTLFRGVNSTPRTDGEPGAQILQKMEFRYALVPFTGSIPFARLSRLALELQAGVYSHHCSAEVGRKSWFKLDAPEWIIPTALKPAGDGIGIVLRLWNLDGESTTARFCFGLAPRQASLCNLNEEGFEPLRIDPAGVISVKVPSRGLSSIRVNW